MKKGLILCIMLCCISSIANAYSKPETWSAKKTIEIDLATEFIAARESYSSKCYKDGHGWSAGYGDFHWCDQYIKVLRWKYPILKLKSDDYVRSLVKMPKDIAKWRLKKFIIEVYDTLDRMHVNNQKITDILDSKRMLSLIDNAYTRGETRFYKDPLWQDIVINYAKTKQIDCVKVAHAFLKQSQYAKKSQRNGVLSRRFSEMMDFTHTCVFDVNFLITVLKKYKV